MLNQNTSLDYINVPFAYKSQTQFSLSCFYMWLFQRTIHPTYGNTIRDNVPRYKDAEYQ